MVGSYGISTSPNIVQHTAKGLKGSDEHDVRTQADTQDPDAAVVLHRRHYARLVQQFLAFTTLSISC